MNLEMYDTMRMKPSNVYYCIVLNNVTNEVTAVYLGEYVNEDDALDAANVYGRRHKCSILWTLDKNRLIGLSSSIVTLLNN
jgi:hypothetical protein